MSNRKFNSFRKKSFGVESLEDRRLMAGDVTAQLVNNTLFLNEKLGQAGQGNAVQVSQIAPGKLRITGMPSSSGGTTRINGLSFVDVTFPGQIPGHLVASFGDGSDSLWVASNVKLNTANINLSAVHAGVVDQDFVSINGLKTSGAVQIDTGIGNDAVQIINSNVGDGAGFDDLTIRTGAGIDYVTVGNTSNWMDLRGNLTVQTRDNYLENDIDVVSLNLLTVHKWITVEMGGGDDTLDMLAVTGGQGMSLAMYGGQDTARLREVELWDGLFANMGEGNDTLDLNYVRAHNQMYLDGAGGSDTLIKSYDSGAPNSTTTGFETINGRRYFTGALGGGVTTGVLTRA